MPEDDSLWVVVNNPPKLMQYNSRSGKLLKAVDINWVRDPEGNHGMQAPMQLCCE